MEETCQLPSGHSDRVLLCVAVELQIPVPEQLRVLIVARPFNRFYRVSTKHETALLVTVPSDLLKSAYTNCITHIEDVAAACSGRDAGIVHET